MIFQKYLKFMFHTETILNIAQSNNKMFKIEIIFFSLLVIELIAEPQKKSYLATTCMLLLLFSIQFTSMKSNKFSVFYNNNKLQFHFFFSLNTFSLSVSVCSENSMLNFCHKNQMMFKLLWPILLKIIIIKIPACVI